MSKVTLAPVADYTQLTLSQINSNMDKVEAALENTLSRDGTSPNQMEADLDMNHKDVLNVKSISADNASLGSLVLAGTPVYPEELVAFSSDYYTVTDPKFGGVTDKTGTASQQTVIETVVALAYSQNVPLFWPAGTYLTTASIPNFHRVRHFGPGVVKRGSDLFPVEPRATDTNRLYFSPSGVSTNDGLSSSQPMSSLQNAFDVLLNYGPRLNGKWTLVAAAGVYNSSSNNTATMPIGLTSYKLIDIIGPDVGGHPTVPIAIFDGTSASTIGCRGVSGAKVRIKDIKFRNYGGNTCIGFSEDSLLSLENVHVDTLVMGVDVQRRSSLYVSGGVFTQQNGSSTNTLLRELFNVYHAIGYTFDESNGNPATGVKPKFVGVKSGRAISVREGCTGHINADIDNFAYGLEIGANSRAHLDDEASFSRCNIAVYMTKGSDVQINSTVNFNIGTAQANVDNVVSNAYSTNFDDVGAVSKRTTKKTILPNLGVTGSTDGTTEKFLYAIPLKAGRWNLTQRGQNIGRTLKVTVVGGLVGTGGNKTLRWRIDETDATVTGVNVTSQVVTNAATGGYRHEFTLHIVDGTNQRCEGLTIAGAASPNPGAASSTVDMNGASDLYLKLTCQLQNAADSFTITSIVEEVEG